MLKNNARLSYLVINLSFLILGLLEILTFNTNAGGFVWFILVITLPCHILIAMNIKNIQRVYWVWGFIHLVLMGGLGSNSSGEERYLAFVIIIYFLAAVVTLPICYIVVRVREKIKGKEKK
ncbi:MAG: hypothetical protein LBQ40_02270 [Clostridiales bacterium]|jgi:hypothetical protein|nr:hypothetical protein [Clostridiales bacterium]